jgi:translocator protein
MNEIASRGQLRMAYLRWALFTVPAILFLGFLSGRVANSGYGNRWFDALEKPGFMPPGWVFPVAWSLLYILLGLAFAMVLHARGARLRGLAIGLFLVQLLCNFAWSPLFFRAHMIGEALALIVVMIALSVAIVWLFARIRIGAAVLMLPYVAWLAFAAALTYSIHMRNPEASTLVVPSLQTQI